MIKYISHLIKRATYRYRDFDNGISYYLFRLSDLDHSNAPELSARTTRERRRRFCGFFTLAVQKIKSK